VTREGTDEGGAPAPRRRVLVIFGGRSAEHEVSVISARSVLEALDPERFDVITVGIDKAGRWHQVNALPAAPSSAGALPAVEADSGPGVALAREPGDRAIVADDGTRTDVDVVFPILHGPYGEDGTMQGLLELAGVPYVGAGVLGSALGMDKAVQKILFTAAGIPVVPHEVVRDREWEEDREAVEARAEALGLPVFVKPAALGSSVGISKVTELDQFPAAMEEALSYGTKAVVERGVEGAREVECAVLGNDDPVASLPGEILPAAGADFYDYRAKYLDDSTRLQIPADLPDDVVGRIQQLAVAAFRAVDGAGMARVDFFYVPPGDLVVNEINTIPGFTPVSMYPKLWEASGVPYADLIERLIDLAAERHDKERKRGRGL
jgi:D-alanine-D-alanine ligase